MNAPTRLYRTFIVYYVQIYISVSNYKALSSVFIRNLELSPQQVLSRCALFTPSKRSRRFYIFMLTDPIDTAAVVRNSTSKPKSPSAAKPSKKANPARRRKIYLTSPTTVGDLVLAGKNRKSYTRRSTNAKSQISISTTETRMSPKRTYSSKKPTSHQSGHHSYYPATSHSGRDQPSLSHHR